MLLAVGCFAAGWLLNELPLKEILIDKWRNRKGGACRVEQLLRLAQMCDEQNLAVPRKIICELEASGFTDQSLPSLPEGSDPEAMLFYQLFFLLAHKSWLISVWLDGSSVCSFRRSKAADYHRHAFMLWWRYLQAVKDKQAFQSIKGEENVPALLAMMESYADYCASPSRIAFLKWTAKLP